MDFGDEAAADNAEEDSKASGPASTQTDDAIEDDEGIDSPIFIGIGPVFFVDNGDLDGSQQIALIETDESYTFSNSPVVSGALWALFPVGSGFSLGGQLQYYGVYTTSPDEEAPDPDNDTRVKSLGHMLDILARVEWAYEIVPSIDLDVVVSAFFGMVMLFPSDDLETEINDLRDQGLQVGAAGLPRLGYAVGPMFGARWRFLNRLAARFDVGVKYEQLFLFNTEENVSGIPTSKDWRLDILRVEIHMGIEVML